MSKFSARLKQRRLDKKLTQQFLADRLGVNRVTYTNWENGKREPELDKVVELATELNTTIDYLLGNADTNPLDINIEDIKNLPPDESDKWINDLKENIYLIFDVAKDKFNISDEEMKLIQAEILKKYSNNTNDKD